MKNLTKAAKGASKVAKKVKVPPVVKGFKADHLELAMDTLQEGLSTVSDVAGAVSSVAEAVGPSHGTPYAYGEAVGPSHGAPYAYGEAVGPSHGAPYAGDPSYGASHGAPKAPNVAKKMKVPPVPPHARGFNLAMDTLQEGLSTASDVAGAVSSVAEAVGPSHGAPYGEAVGPSHGAPYGEAVGPSHGAPYGEAVGPSHGAPYYGQGQGSGAEWRNEAVANPVMRETAEPASGGTNESVYSTKMTFEESFQEHEGAETIDAFKTILKWIYEFFLKCTYNAIMFTIGVCVVMFWGVCFSCLVWVKIWCISPMSSTVIVVMKGCMPIILEPIRMCKGVCCKGRRKK